MKIKLERVHYMPATLEPGILYVSEEFGAAAHLCPCGCGSKIRTPLGPTEWSLRETKSGPTLCPSIGNWQIPCQSHYWIWDGIIEWSTKWTSGQIVKGRQTEEQRRQVYFASLYKTQSFLRRIWRLIKKPK